MRKLISILTVCVLLLVCCLPVAAQSASTTVEVESSDLFVEVTVKTTQDANRLTLKVVNTQNNVALYTAQKTTPDSEAEGVKTYEFSFYAKDGTVSGKYRAIAGGFGATATSDDFSLITKADKRAFYNTLDTKAAGDIQVYFSQNDLFLPQPYTDYAQVAPDLLDLINAEIAGMNLAVAADYSNLAAVDNAFCEFYAKSVLLANVIQEDDVSDWDGYIQELVNDFNFYDEYYDKLTPSEVYAYFATEKSNTIDLDIITTAFDESVILAVTKNFNATFLRDAVADYEARGTVTMDLTYYNTLDEDEKLTVCETVKEKAPTTFALFCQYLDEKAEELATGGGQGGSLGGDLGGGFGGGGNVSVSGDREETPTTPVTPETVSFTDIAHVGWAQEAITYLAKEGVLNGKETGKFYPDDYVTREEFVKIISEAFGYTKDTATADFSDVPESKWSYKYVASAYAAGIISGTGDGYFGAGDKITRQDMAVILSRVLALADIEASGGENFADESKMADYAKEAIDMLSALGIVNGMGDGTFAPQANVTRAQAAKAIYETLMIVIK